MMPNAIHQLDCLEGMSSLEACSVDVIVTSPPYNIGKSYTSYDDTLSRPDYLAWMGDVAGASHRVLSERGSFFLNIGGTRKIPGYQSMSQWSSGRGATSSRT